MNARTVREILGFGAVGVLGYFVDTGTLLAVKPYVGPYGGRAISYVVAATTNFLLNRHFTFGVRGRENFFKQWASFLIANLGGGALNYTTYALLTAYAPAPANNPWAAVAAGSLAGMAVNFTLTKRVVFAKR